MTAHRGHRARVEADRLVIERLTPLDVSNVLSAAIDAPLTDGQAS